MGDDMGESALTCRCWCAASGGAASGRRRCNPHSRAGPGRARKCRRWSCRYRLRGTQARDQRDGDAAGRTELRSADTTGPGCPARAGEGWGPARGRAGFSGRAKCPGQRDRAAVALAQDDRAAEAEPRRRPRSSMRPARRAGAVRDRVGPAKARAVEGGDAVAGGQLVHQMRRSRGYCPRRRGSGPDRARAASHGMNLHPAHRDQLARRRICRLGRGLALSGAGVCDQRRRRSGPPQEGEASCQSVAMS